MLERCSSISFHSWNVATGQDFDEGEPCELKFDHIVVCTHLASNCGQNHF